MDSSSTFDEATAGTMSEFVFDPFAAELIEDPYPAYRTLRDRFPVYRNSARGLWFLSRFEEVYAAARDHSAFSSADGIDIDDTGPQFGAGVLVEIDPPKHDHMRKLLKADFTPKAVAALENSIREYTERYVRRILAEQGGDVVRDLTWRLPIDVMGDLLGGPSDDRERLGELLMTFLERIPGQPQIPAESLDAAVEMRSYFSDLVRERRRDPGTDFASRLIGAEADGDLTSDEVDGLFFFFFFFFFITAGTDSPSDLMSTAMFLLDEYEDQRRALINDPSLIASAVEEVLRFEAPLQNYARSTTKDIEVRGEVIPRGERVVLVAGAANRDERRFDDPDMLDVTRKPKRNLAFGEGIHFCLGAPLARLQARVLLETVLTMMPNYRLVGPVLRATKQNNRGFRQLGIAVD